MHNRETARHFEVKPQGNARGFGFSDEPLIRMRNTAILPGKSKQNDMISSIDDGYYLIKTGNPNKRTIANGFFRRSIISFALLSAGFMTCLFTSIKLPPVKTPSLSLT